MPTKRVNLHKCREVWSEPKPLTGLGFRWCRRAGLNCRPQPYQGCALPLSYGGVGRGSSESRRRREAEKRGKPAKGLTKSALGHTASAMTQGPKQQNPKPAPDAREARLARALRENLRRRKAGTGEGGRAKDVDEGEH